MADILALPERQRQIATWMIRRKDSTLPEVAAHLGEAESVVRRDLAALVEQGIVQEVWAAGASHYYIDLARRRGSQVAEMIYQVQTPGNPLGTILNPSGEVAVRAGERFELSVTVANQGNVSALVDIFIDESSTLVRQWCRSPHERLALGAGQTSEVFFEFEVPVATAPGPYDYLLAIDAPQHYPEDTPILHQGRLQVLPLIQETRKGYDPTFTLQPTTSSIAPALVQPGTLLEISAIVHNRSDRVDRFRLTCPDLAVDWYRVSYPEGLPTAGIVVTADGLELNPGDRGEIQLAIAPPVDTRAGVYSPTVRLYCANQPDLVLLDVVYLQVLPIYLLNVELLTLVGRVRNRAGLFTLQLHNAGNTPRELVIYANSADGADWCTLTVTPARVQLQPGESQQVRLQVQPTQKWWRHSFVSRRLNFVVELEDVEQLPLTNTRFQGVLVWDGRPWWHLLLLILTILGTIGAIALLIWWFFPRPLAPPEIVEFAPASNAYQEANGEGVRLNWTIANPTQLQTLRLQGVSPDGVTISGPVEYDWRRGIPNTLRDYCAIEQELVCQNVPTDARQAGDYVFELSALGKRKNDTPATRQTNTVRIEPIPLPQVVELAPTQPTYQEASTAADATPEPTAGEILLNWTISHPDRIRELKLIGRAPDGTVNRPLTTYDFSRGIPDALGELCAIASEGLRCENVPTNAREAGTYVFELTVIPQTSTEEPPTQKTDPIKIEPTVIPIEIVEFQVNGTDALPKYLIEVEPDEPILLTLSWQVEGGDDLKTELLPAPGTVATEGSVSYPLSQTPGSETITLQVTNAAGEQVSRSVTIETFSTPPPEPIPLPPPPPPATAGSATTTVPVLEPPAPSSGAAPSAPGATSPPGAAEPSPSPSQPTPLPPPPGASPPIPPDRNSPPPAELPPQVH
jgi:hypothetical protein